MSKHLLCHLANDAITGFFSIARNWQVTCIGAPQVTMRFTCLLLAALVTIGCGAGLETMPECENHYHVLPAVNNGAVAQQRALTVCRSP